MTITLHLGVVDVPYVENEAPAKRKARISRNAKKPRGRKAEHASASEKTTGDIATILEAKYGVMEAFYDNNEVAIVGDLEESLAGALENLIAGAPPSNDPFGDATSKIEDRFKTFLSSYEAEKVGIEGAPTKAARRGVNHRKKHPYAKGNARRPSFIDTGLYEASMKTWVE